MIKNIKSEILTIVKLIESKYDVKVIFAIENGSRAWRMESDDSDYDVRFIYALKVNDYISIKPQKDVITECRDENGKPCSQEGALIDMTGFEITKFLKLLNKSNPTTIEWLTTDIVYYGKQPKKLQEFANKYFNPKTLYEHYRSMSNNNYVKYLKSKNLVTYKKYLYSLRGLVNALWVKEKNSIPPIIFIDAVNGLKNYLPEIIVKEIHKMIKLKSSGKEKDIITNIKHVDKFIESFLKSEFNPKIEHVNNIDVLEKELHRIVLK